VTPPLACRLWHWWQVHRAVLVDGREVAVKVQRPSEEPKLRGDIANLKAFAQRFRSSLPVDYYPVFCELEKALANELDFLAEAQSTEKVGGACRAKVTALRGS
jgi:predicted unusual protein kinase regulating ubiquinone biosynthesis (AarF/ABC1/UbiB family)